MKKRFVLLAVAGGLFLLVSGCDLSDWVIPEDSRVTFALVINTRIYNGYTVYADVYVGSESGAFVETVSAPLGDFPNTGNDIAWAQMTTLELIATNQRYRLNFYIDLTEDGTMNAGDKKGYQEFEVTPSAEWSESKYFYEDLEDVT
jgi:hypothetical protein